MVLWKYDFQPFIFERLENENDYTEVQARSMVQMAE
jgi:hypothetical protein